MKQLRMKLFTVLCALVAAAFGDVSHLQSSEYLPPPHEHAASAPVVSFSSAPAVAYSAPADESHYTGAASAPAGAFSAPAPSYESTSYEGAASEPAHTFSASQGYNYRTIKRRVIRRHRRDVSHLSNDYLPPAASAPEHQYESAPSYTGAASETAVQYSAPDSFNAPSEFAAAASEPAHSFSSAEGYRYKAIKRRVIRRHRRDVSHLPSEYLPPHQGAASAPSVEYLAPAAASSPVAQFESAPSYSAAASAPVADFQAADTAFSPSASYEGAASDPAHSYSSTDGYRYKTVKRRILRRHRF